MTKRIALSSDHAAIELRQAIAAHISAQGYEAVDIGPTSLESTHYPKHGQAAAELVASGDCDLGIILCGTGQGIMMAANKVKGIRCGVCSETFSARMIRQHNNANMLSIGERVTGAGLALDIVDAFLSAEIYELDASAEQYLIKVNGSGSVPIPMGAFKVGAEVAFSFEYDSAAGSSTMTSLLVDASVSATIGDPAAPNFELEGRAVYEYPCTTTVSATGTVNMTFDSNFRVGPLETSLVLYCPSNANEHELKSEEQLQGSKTAFVLSVMTGKDGIVELTLGDAVLTASDVRITAPLAPLSVCA